MGMLSSHGMLQYSKCPVRRRVKKGERDEFSMQHIPARYEVIHMSYTE